MLLFKLVLSMIRHVLLEMSDETIGSTAKENPTNFLQRLVNSMDEKLEVSSQVGVMIVFDFMSWHGSHKF